MLYPLASAVSVTCHAVHHTSLNITLPDRALLLRRISRGLGVIKWAVVDFVTQVTPARITTGLLPMSVNHSGT